MTLKLTIADSSVEAIAEADALTLRTTSTRSGETARLGVPTDDAGMEADRLVSIELGQLQEQGLAESTAEGTRVLYRHFATIRDLGFKITSRWTEWSPFMLSISPAGDLGRPDFEYRYRFLLGSTEVLLERVGYFVRRTGRMAIFHLDDQTYAVVEAMDRFNRLSCDAKTERENWVTFSMVKGCSRDVGASLDVLLQANEVVIPSRIALKIHQHEDGSVSFVPRCGGVPEEELRKAFFAHPDVEGVYSMDLLGGSRLRVVFDDEQQEILRRMKLVQGVHGTAKREAIQHPERFFDGVLDKVDLPYGKRVVGVGEFQFVPVPHQAYTRSGLFDGIERDVPATPDGGSITPVEQDGSRPTSILCKSADGTDDVAVEFPDAEARRQFRNLVRSAVANGENSITFGGSEIRVDDALADVLLQPPQSRTRDANQSGGAKAGLYLLIYTDDDDLKPWDEEAVNAVSTPQPLFGIMERPSTLREDVHLKEHQQKGIAWLQTCAALRLQGRRGALLADDMGLGKTLQILCYLAWSIEKGYLSAPDLDPSVPPWRPILIIAPLILVEDGTWEKEIARFFKAEGAIFDPIAVLRGKTLDDFRTDKRPGRDILVGEPILDAQKLQRHRVIITNYETIKNYQHSFAQTVNGTPMWSVVVTDEAQEYKTPNTKISHAVKALQPDFHIACTGTPVENRLLDIWNIMDCLQPALLGTSKTFSSTYETPLVSSDPGEVLTQLKDRLLFGHPNAFLVRRDKRALPDLPKKREVRLLCDLSPGDVDTHLSLVSKLRSERQKGTHLGIIHRLSQLYQHPSLLNDSWSSKRTDTLLLESAKLRVVIEELQKVCHRREKAIIFARLVAMQQLLALVLSETFDLNVQIINGSTARSQGERSSASTKRAKDTRAKILDDFKSRPGFNIVVLSPFVAGVGLTITEANHVFHYGRWWNPAVEAQATDRAYRIGQDKDVSVYFPVFQDQTGRLSTSFDECLDNLLQRKARLASDFLRPIENESSNMDELCGELLGDDGNGGESGPTLRAMDRADIDRLSPSDFEALVACLYDAQGFCTVLTCQSNDAGVDVVAIKGHEAWLLQAKHSSANIPVTPEAIDDVLTAQTVYQNSVGKAFSLAVISNSRYSGECINRARDCGVVLIGGRDLSIACQTRGFSIGDVVAKAGTRAKSFAEGVELARRLFR